MKCVAPCGMPLREATQLPVHWTGWINMTGLGDGMEDRQLVVSQDCRTLYLLPVRAGGNGRRRSYAADILPMPSHANPVLILRW
jgi:hypothetical protein